MKKSIAVLILSGICVAVLFAQETVSSAPGIEMPAAEIIPAGVAEEKPGESPAPITVVRTEVEPTAEPAAPVEVEVAVEPEPKEKTDEIGIADDMTAGAEVIGGRISLSLKDVELQDVVRLFSRLSNANIIVPDMLDQENPKRIDVNLNNVEWKPALKAILDTHGLELIEKIPGSEVYGIRERPVDAPEPVEIKVYKLDYATVEEVVMMVTTLVQKGGGQISTYPARNTIVAQGTAQLLSDLDQMITAVDLPRQQVFIEAKFMELNDSASEKLGVDWQVLGGYGIGMSDISGGYSFEDSKVDGATDFFGKNSTGSADESFLIGEEDVLGAEISAGDVSLDESIVNRALGATLNASDFQLVLSALKDINGVKVVSNPKIIVSNEETASIHIGNKKPNIKGTLQTAGDNQLTQVFALDDKEPYFEDGIKVDVTPTVNTEDNITVRIRPTLDRLDEGTTAPDGTTFYGKRTKTINTQFSLEDGQTAAIGGLTEVSANEVDRKIPLLGDIPFIGRLFSYTAKENRQTETIIFVTVGLANPENINMETGLPQDSTLAMREYFISQTERNIQAEELKILEDAEAKRLQSRMEDLRKTEKGLLNSPEEE